jgi:hypothetical protein
MVKKETQGVFSKLVGVMQASLKPKKQNDKGPMICMWSQPMEDDDDDAATQDGCQLSPPLASAGSSSSIDGCQLAGSSQPAIIIDATQLSASESNMDDCAPPGSSMDGQPGNVDELSTSLMQIQIVDNPDVEPTNAWATNEEGFTFWTATKWWQHRQEVLAGGWINWNAEAMSATAFQQWQIRMGRWVDWTANQWRDYGWTGYENQPGNWQDYLLAIPEEAPTEENIPALE